MLSVTIYGITFPVWALVAAGAGIILAILIVVLLCWYFCCCHRRRKREREVSPLQKQNQGLPTIQPYPQAPGPGNKSQHAHSLPGSYHPQHPQHWGGPSEKGGGYPSPQGPPPHNHQISPVGSGNGGSGPVKSLQASGVSNPPYSVYPPYSPGPVAKWEANLQAMTFRKMSLEEVSGATNEFDERNFLGEGAFAVVYQGTGPAGVPWAVKRSKKALKEGSAGAQDFENEVMMISRLSHKHLVRLLGYCTEADEHILVYEFAENGSLGNALGRSHPNLPFAKRLEIAIGTAEALNYLHTAASPPIVHRDIKPDNIMLDANCTPKVADFGLLKNLMDGAQFESVYTRIAGTPGYLDPDYHLTSKVTTKGDVYSFGVVLLELCTGQRAIIQADTALNSSPADSASKLQDSSATRGHTLGQSSVASFEKRLSRSRDTDADTGPVHISMWVAPYVQAKVVEPIADPRFGNNYSKTALFRLMEIGLLCTTATSRKRPDMGAVVRWLHEVQEQLRRSESEMEGCEEEEEGHYSSVFQGASFMQSMGGGSGRNLEMESSMGPIRESSARGSGRGSGRSSGRSNV